jgi:hypothetical protein
MFPLTLTIFFCVKPFFLTTFDPILALQIFLSPKTTDIYKQKTTDIYKQKQYLQAKMKL